MFSDGESTFGPRKPPDSCGRIWPIFRRWFRGPGQIFVPTAEGFRGPEGQFRGPGEIRQAMADRFHLNKNPLPISAQR